MVLDRKTQSEALVGLQLSALLGGGLKTSDLDQIEQSLENKPE